MDLWTAAKILLRRWYVTLPVLLLGLAATLAVDSRLEPTYQATGSVVLVPPQVSNVALPYGGIRNTTEVLERRLQAAPVGLILQSKGITASYAVENERDYPILNFVAEAETPQMAVNAVQELATQTSEQLVRLQQDLGYPADQHIGMDVLVSPERATELNRARTRALFALILLSVAGATIAALIVEGVARRPAKRESSRVAASEWPPQRYGHEGRPDDDADDASAAP